VARRLNKKRRRPQSQTQRCETTGKFSYQSKAHALSATLNRAVKGGQRLRVYKCPDCGFWHMTKQVTTKEGQQ
jgi:predicted RNA-binding Zn-ribbon protein involved in translation (DUF1610 family)